MMSPELQDEAKAHLKDERPTKIEVLANAIREISLQIDELTERKLLYEYELDKLIKEENA